MTIRRRLMSDLVLLIALAGGAILVATWISGARTIEELSRSLIDRTTRHTEGELKQFFGLVRSNVLTGRDWAEAGILDATDADAMNALFVPILQQHPQLSSMMVADSDGVEYLLLRDPLASNTWSNRIVQADRWGTRVFNREWNTSTGEVEQGFGELEYDPRKRVWYRQALLTTPENPVFWTEPVIFFVTKDPGITASTHWVTADDPQRTVVVAYDLLLMDISKFTSRLNVSRRGKAFVLAENPDTGGFKVVGLPADARYQSDASIRDALVFVPPERAVADTDAQLPAPDQLPVPSVSAAVNAWVNRGRPRQPLRFSSDGETWWGGFHSFPLGANTFWIGVVVPERDMSASIRQQQLLLMAIVLAVLLVGLFRAVWLARRFSTPVESLVAQVERISRGDLESGEEVESNVREIRRLAQAHDKMREGLKTVIKLEKLERDLDIAREIQQGLLPDEPPDTPGFEVAGWNRPADQTGGDYFDWLTLPDGQTFFTLADVTGHGIGPALIVAVYRAYMRASTVGGKFTLSQAIGRINKLLCADIPEGRFVTAAFGLIDPAEQQVELLSAGQAPLIYYEAATAKLHNWDADDVPLGIADDMEFESARRIRFSPGDMLVLTTDGFFEATNTASEQFGTEALEQFVRDHHQLAPDEFIAQLYQQVRAHMAGAQQGDDLTALVIKRSVSRG